MAKTRAKKSDAEKKSNADDNQPSRSQGRPMWNGSISFGLVNIPIRLYPAIRREDVRFHLLHEKDKSRLQEKLFCPVDDQEVPRKEAIKGYEISKNQHVLVTQAEIDSLAPKASRTIEFLNVVEMKDIDPIYFDRPYYLLPEERATKAYMLLVEALTNSKKGAIAKFVMRNKEYIGAIRPIKRVLCLDTLHFADEIIGVGELPFQPPAATLKEAETKMAQQLLESFAGEFNPKELHDDYREALLKLVQKKAEGQEIAVQPEVEEEAPQVIDLMDALKKSMAQVQSKKGKKAA